MSVVVRLTDEAEADLNEAAQWYEARSAGLGTELIVEVREAVRRISENPLLYGEIDLNLRREPLRRFPYGLIYRTGTDQAEVIALFHQRRDPTIWRNRI